MTGLAAVFSTLRRRNRNCGRSRPSGPDEDRDSFARLLWAEWIKLRTVRAWLITLIASAVTMTVFSLLSAAGERSNCDPAGCPTVVVGPGGEAVADSYELVARPLTGNGTITVELTSLTGLLPSPGHSFGQPIPPAEPLSAGHPGVEPWAKAGLIITANTRQGAAYAAVMLAADHGVRFQDDYTGDIAGPADTVAPGSPRWLRLTRAGDTVTAYVFATRGGWIRIGSADLSGLPSTVEAGLFVTSPQDAQLTDHPFAVSGADGPTLATAAFAHLTMDGAGPSAESWTGRTIGGPNGGYPALPGSYSRLGNGSYQVSGSGDIAPEVGGAEGVGVTIDHTLAGGFFALIVVIALGAVSATAEYRRGLIRTTLTATPRRGRVLAAKAVVIGVSTFALTLPAAAVSLLVGKHVLLANHNLLYPASTLTETRVVVGTAGLLAGAAVLALALGVILRRSSGAITVGVVAIVLPYLLFQALPAGAADWLLRVTPTAALSVQQTLAVYPQVANDYSPTSGYFPLAPWAGFAVLCAYAAVALAVAAVLLHRRDP